jgi:hypothetical protein
MYDAEATVQLEREGEVGKWGLSTRGARETV